MLQGGAAAGAGEGGGAKYGPVADLPFIWLLPRQKKHLLIQLTPWFRPLERVAADGNSVVNPPTE